VYNCDLDVGQGGAFLVEADMRGIPFIIFIVTISSFHYRSPFCSTACLFAQCVFTLVLFRYIFRLVFTVGLFSYDTKQHVVLPTASID